MSVLLYTSSDLAGVLPFDWWVQIPDGKARNISVQGRARPRPDLGQALEDAFNAEAKVWWLLAKTLSATPSACLAHTPACAPNASDFGLMLAWTRLVRDWSGEESTTLVVCADPWMFRHLRDLPGVVAGSPPALWPRTVALWARGYLARCSAALRHGAASLRMRGAARAAAQGGAWILVYGHPASTADGTDGYFGDLMRNLPGLRRVLHVDCPPARGQVLTTDGRTVSLHGFGNPFFAAVLPFARWRPIRAQRRSAYGWLIRRAAAREGGTGQAAAIRWQLHCQERWLARCRPGCVAWPWENHAWERVFVRATRRCGIRTIGYQHSVIGRQMLNYAPASNADGMDSLPDRVLCTGAATQSQLLHWDVPQTRLKIGGALRFQQDRPPLFSADGPVFMALPFDGETSREMIEAGRRIAANGRRLLVKDHPMTPFPFEESPGIERTNQSLNAQQAVSAVVYAATTVGLEAVLAGIPTLRFRPQGRIALDILPGGVNVPAVDSETLSDALDHAQRPMPVAVESVFAPVDLALWQKELG